MDELTKTFQDAVLATRALSISYLWIDSLCIVQNNADDWAREASKIVFLYQNVLITFAATAFDSGIKGLFFKSSDHDFYGYTKHGEQCHFVLRESGH